MKNFTAKVTLVYGTGAIGNWQYFSGTGCSMSNSPKKAVNMARKLADRSCGDGSVWMLVDEVVWLNGELLNERFPFGKPRNRRKAVIRKVR